MPQKFSSAHSISLVFEQSPFAVFKLISWYSGSIVITLLGFSALLGVFVSILRGAVLN